MKVKMHDQTGNPCCHRFDHSIGSMANLSLLYTVQPIIFSESMIKYILEIMDDFKKNFPDMKEF